MQMRTKLKRAGLLAMILLLITLATAFAADSGEVKVTEGVDGRPYRTRAVAVATDGLGNAVVAWPQSDGTYPNPQKIYARRYDNTGQSIQLIQVEALPSSRIPGYVDVAMNDTGAFVVAWTQHGADAEGYSVHAALYGEIGNLMRGPFQVNTTEIDYQWLPSVAIDDDGDFFIAWEQVDGNPFPNGPRDVHGQFYDSAGNRVGSEFTINTTTGGYQHQVDVSMAGDGRAIAVWHSEPVNTGTQSEAIYGQIFDANGVRIGGEIQLSSSDISIGYPTAFMDDSGGFVVAWDTSPDIFVRQFADSGAAQDDEFAVGGGNWPDLAGDGDGNFAVVWEGQDGAASGIYAQLYDSNGTPEGDEFRVNVGTDEVEEFPAIAMNDTDHYVFAWGRYLLPNNGMDGIYTRFLDGPPTNTAPAAFAGIYANTLTRREEGTPFTLSSASASDPDGDELTYSWSMDTSLCTFDDPTMLNPTLTCIDDANFTVTLVVDDGTTTNSSDGPVQVHNVAPDITISGADTVAAGDTYTLNLSEITDPGDDTVSAITVIWGDGDTDTYSNTGDVTHVYDEPGDYLIRVSLTDEDGSYTNRDSMWLTVNSANSAPKANDDSYTVDEDAALTVDAPGILDNDSDADGDPLTAALESDVSHGFLALNPDGSFSYTPDANYYGPDSFTYLAGDGEITSNVASVAIEVVSINDAPVATDDAATTDEDAAVTLGLAANDTDVDGNLDAGSLSITALPDNGAVTNHGDGAVTYTPATDYFGADSFSYEICDGEGLCDTAAVALTINPVNDPPVISAGGPYSGDEGSAIALDGSASDVDGDALAFSWSSDGPCEFSEPTVLNPTITCDDDGSFTATLAVNDGADSSSSNATVAIANVTPTIDLSGAASTDEGANYGLTLGAVGDPGDDTVTEYVVHWGDGESESVTSNGNVSHVYGDGPAVHNITVDLVDEDGTHAGAGNLEVSVDNVAPTIDLIEAPTDPVALDAQPVAIQMYFSDPGSDTHDTAVDWGDGTSDTYGDSDSVSADHTYLEPGVFTLAIEVTDDDDGSDNAIYEYVVIYDPEGGFVTGHGRIVSEAGWCHLDDVCSSAEGNARFGFVSRYKQGASTPTGRTDFVFRAGNLDLESSSYSWLVVNQGGANAQFRGEGLINGSASPGGSEYQFMIWAGEGTGANGEDTFRIKIWYETEGGEVLVYDNGFDQAIDSGKIKVQKN